MNEQRTDNFFTILYCSGIFSIICKNNLWFYHAGILELDNFSESSIPFSSKIFCNSHGSQISFHRGICSCGDLPIANPLKFQNWYTFSNSRNSLWDPQIVTLSFKKHFTENLKKVAESPIFHTVERYCFLSASTWEASIHMSSMSCRRIVVATSTHSVKKREIPSHRKNISSNHL